MFGDTSERNRRVLRLVGVVKEQFEAANWLELGLVTNCTEMIRNHDRLLRSLHFKDEDYGGHVLSVILAIIERNDANLETIELYVQEKLGGGENVSSTPILGRRIVFAPTAFQIPDTQLDPSLVSVMMPFSMPMAPVYTTITEASQSAGMHCLRADNVWEHATVIQDIFGLIFRSFIVVCDFTGRNPNVFYEAGIAHTLGKHVIPITQSAEDIPFDLRHHRYIHYLNNEEGRAALKQALMPRLRSLAAERHA